MGKYQGLIPMVICPTYTYIDFCDFTVYILEYVVEKKIFFYQGFLQYIALFSYHRPQHIGSCKPSAPV